VSARPLPDAAHFGRFQHLVESIAGIYLSDAKGALLWP